MSNKIVHEYFPDEYIALHAELVSGFHPVLEDILSKTAADEIDMKLAHVASYCEVALDGTYTLEERMNLCKILRERLIERRMELAQLVIPKSIFDNETTYGDCSVGEYQSLIPRTIQKEASMTQSISNPQKLSPLEITYIVMVSMLVKPGALIKSELSDEDCNRLHMAIGISGEAGELLDAIKKATVYRKPVDLANVIEELGDLEFYMEGLRQSYGITRDECLEANIKKLTDKNVGRYPNGFSNAAAVERRDKQEETEPRVSVMYPFGNPV